MKEVFQNYNHYAEWIFSNWQKNKIIDELIIQRGLLVEKINCCNGNAFRQLTKEEFRELESFGFIEIPLL